MDEEFAARMAEIEMLAAAPTPPASVLPAPEFQGVFDSEGSRIGEILQLETHLSDKDIKTLSDYIARITQPAQEDEPEAWLIEYQEGDFITVKLCRHNAIGDYRATYPDAQCTPLYPHRPQSDELRKAAKELIETRKNIGNFPIGLSLERAVNNLRVALERK